MWIYLLVGAWEDHMSQMMWCGLLVGVNNSSRERQLTSSNPIATHLAKVVNKKKQKERGIK
jgi:hypothetical protein